MSGQFRRSSNLAARFRLSRPGWSFAGWLAILCVCAVGFELRQLVAQPAAETPAEEPPPTEEPFDKLPLLESMTVPSAEQFLTEKKLKDWLVVKKDGKVRVIEVLPLYPKSPRPGTLAELRARKPNNLKGVKNEKQLREALPYLNVTIDSDSPEYRIDRKFLEDIIYYEDMLLQRVDESLDKKQVRLAYELLDRLEQSSPNWAGANERRHRLIFVEAGLRLAAGDLETALAMVQELYTIGREMKPPRVYPGLSTLLGEVVDPLVSEALQRGDFRRARHFLARLRRLEERHPVLLKWAKDLEARSTEKIRLAQAASRAGQPAEAIDRIEEAAGIWPQTAELFGAHRALSENYPRLRVGTVDSPSEKGPVQYVLSADVRRKLLTETRLFQPARMDDDIVRYETRLFTEWEPANLGHSIQFQMLQHRGDWESQPAITAGTVVATIAHRLDPHRPEYDARIGSAVEFLSVSSPFDFRVNFRQAPLRPEALFSIPLELSGGGAGSLAPNGQPSWPFYLHAREGRNTIYRRSHPEPQRATDRHIAEIIETKYDDYAAAVQGLLRGEVSLLPRAAPSDQKKFEQHGDFFVFTSPLPETHVLQFHPGSKAMANRALRRALVYSLNRQQMLESVFLQEPEGRLGRLTSGPFATRSYAYNPTVKPHRFDPILAYSLVLGARSELKTLPTLKMICPQDPTIRAAAKEMAEHWSRMFEKLGLKVVLLDAPPPGTIAGQIATAAAKGGATPDAPAEWDIRYEVIRMAEPLVELWAVAAQTNGTDINSIQHIPTWLRQELLMLEQAGDMSSAKEILQRLHKHMWAEVQMIPLWELNPVTVVRKTIRGLPRDPIEAYQGIESWRMEPWYPRDIVESGTSDQKR